MTMHGLFWRFPGSFTSSNSAGIRPRSSYLKVIGDYTRWNDQLVFGCDDRLKMPMALPRYVPSAPTTFESMIMPATVDCW